MTSSGHVSHGQFEPEVHVNHVTSLDPYDFNPIPTDSIGFSQDQSGFSQDQPLIGQFLLDYESRNPPGAYSSNVPTMFDIPPSTPAPTYEKPPPSNEMTNP